MTGRRIGPPVNRANLIGAYRRHTVRGLPTDDVDQRIAELEATAPAEIIEESRRLAEPATAPPV